MLKEEVTSFGNDSSAAKSDKNILHLDLATAGDLFSITVCSEELA